MNKFNLLVLLISWIAAQMTPTQPPQMNTNQNIVYNCYSNQECQQSMGNGSCCLYEEQVNLNRTTYTCRNKDFVNYYLNPKNYDQVSQVWTNPEDVSDRMKVFCKPLNSSTLNYTYPLNQTFAPNYTLPVLYDPRNTNVRSDQFYMPKRVTGFGDQFLKWLNAAFWYFLTPLPALIGFNNFIFYTWDLFAFWGDPLYAGMKPTMYDNWFSRLLMANPWGVFAWYDVFSVQGYFNWMADSYVLAFFPWVSLIQGFIRQGRNDWTYLTWEARNPIDKNRLFRPVQLADPYDYNYWSTKQDGRDCNGNVGPGNYCFCPSQGYICQCQPNDWYAPGQQRLLCNDHYGYDCNGNYVDGETNWCNDPMNIYWVLNQNS